MAQSVYDLPPKMIHDIAVGEESPHVIAARYGFDDLAYFDLLRKPAFTRLVDDRRAELAKDGSLYKVQCRLLSEANLQKIGILIMRDDTSLKDRLEAQKLLTRGAGLEGDSPGAGLTVNAGAGTSINIIYPGAEAPKPKPKGIVIEQSIDPAIEEHNADLLAAPDETPADAD